MWNVKLSYDKDILDMRDYAVKNYSYKPGKGAYFQTGVDCVRKRRNEKHPSKKIEYFSGVI
jgi:hypothetical protein